MRLNQAIKIIAFFILSWPFMSAQAADRYTITTSGFTTIMEHGACLKVRSQSGSRMVPTKTASEWASFRNNATGIVTQECVQWVQMANANEAPGAACNRVGGVYANNSRGWGTCASGENRPTSGDGATSLSYIYGTWGGAGTGGTILQPGSFGTFCWKGGQARDNDGTDRAIGFLCDLTGAAGSCALPASLGGGRIANGGVIQAYQAASGAFCSSQNRTCSNGTLSGTYLYYTCTVNDPCGSGGCSCFTAGTKIAMADGGEKNIEELVPGDVLLGMDGAHNTVLRMEIPKLSDRPEGDRSIYAFNGGPFFVTSEHPFMLETGQWASVKPDMTYIRQPKFKERYGEVKKLEIGDVIVRLNGEKMTIETIESRDRYPDDMPVYNPTLDGNNTYYADGFLVHNRN